VGVETVATTPALPRVRRVDVLVFAALAYIPFLLSSPGKVSGDTKQYLYLDPARLLSRAVSLWDPHIGTGTVPHQNVGYLFPMGPYYWLMDQVGVPDWVAQRLWMGSISFAAAAGALWLFTMLGTGRAGAIAGAVVYMLTPYQLAFTARISVLLLAWAGLPWLVGLTIRAAKRGGWRDPVLFALVVLVIGGTNASSLILVGIAPVLWLVVASVQGEVRPRAALATAGRIALPTVGVSLWWVAGLASQARYGIPVLDVTETLRQVADGSRPAELLRGFGNWFFSGGERIGPWLDQSADYHDQRLLAVATLAVPVAGLAAAAIVRWRHRAYCVALVVVGTIVGVGAWPYDDPSPLGDAFKTFVGRGGAAAALRNSPRVVPIIVLGLAGLLAAGVGALRGRPRARIGAAVAVCAVVVLAFLPVWRHGYLSERIQRDEDIPEYWHDVAAALDRGDDGTRALELPGSLFAAYRWGNTVDPVTPGLTDRPWVGRELMPFGTRGSVDLLAALDRQLEQGSLEPAAIAPIARLLGVGTIVVRNDLEYERYDTPAPRQVWSIFTDPLVPGLDPPEGFGPSTPNTPTPAFPMLDEVELRTSGIAWPPKVALFDVESPRRIVSAASTDAPLVLAGDGEGAVDAAAAGLLDGKGVLLYSATLDRAELRRALADDAELVVTDTARRRARRWNTLRDDVGVTERAGEESAVEDVDDFRFEITPDLTDDDRTVTEQQGGTVEATAYGATNAYVPSLRPARAFDGDVRTSWRVAEGSELDGGERLTLELAKPVRADGVTLVQPLGVNRQLTRAWVRINGGAPIAVDLDASSRTDAGQRVAFPEQEVRSIELEPREAVGDLAEGVGFAEVRLDAVGSEPSTTSGSIGSAPLVDEVLRVPTSLLRRAGADAAARPVGFVFTRERRDPGEHGRIDPELALSRRFVLPATAVPATAAGGSRAFGIGGTARVDANAPDDVIDTVLGTAPGGVRYGSSGHLAGDAAARASRAFDGDSTTAWTAPFADQRGQYVDVDLGVPTDVQGATMTVVADGRHSVPTRVRVEADGVPVATIAIPAIAIPAIEDRAEESATQQVPLAFGPVEATRLRFVVEEARVAATLETRTLAPIAAPVSVAEIEVSGVPKAPNPAAVPDTCHTNVLTVDGVPMPVRLVGTPADARRGLTVESCAAPLALRAGSHVARGSVGLDTAIDLDRLVLTSGADGAAVGVEGFTAGRTSSGAEVRVVDSGATTYDLRVKSDGEPFWLVLGQSHSAGWTAELDGTSLGEPQLVDGYANGWLVDPQHAGTFEVHLKWTGQNLVWVMFALSVLAIVACLAVVLVTRRRRRPDVSAAPELTSPLRYEGAVASWRVSVGAAVAVGVAAAIVSRLWIGAVVGVSTLLASRIRNARILLAGGAPAALVLAKAADIPELGWLAVLLLLADLINQEGVRGGGGRGLSGR
jgi:hypothetical protein